MELGEKDKFHTIAYCNQHECFMKPVNVCAHQVTFECFEGKHSIQLDTYKYAKSGVIGLPLDPVNIILTFESTFRQLKRSECPEMYDKMFEFWKQFCSPYMTPEEAAEYAKQLKEKEGIQ